ncbi:MAG: M48 family metallopeptidase [Pyrinomonadaceae bacterium]
MNKKMFRQRFAALMVAAVVFAIPAIAQTRVNLPKNKYKVQDDVQVGNKASAEIEQKFPILRDQDAQTYVQRVGERLVAAIPAEFQQPAFNYRFRVVNARDINAFALPGGPMYVNRGMIEAARNEGEMAGVMAHEISHVALRHATAQATKQGSAKNTLGTLGLILGGAILGGQTGAQLGGMAAQAWMTKYSREYETQADVLGSRIMADAGYDPRDLANMFRTIAGERQGGGGPEWLSSHPDPGNRYENINREAQFLRVSGNPIKITRDFERVKANLRTLPRAPTMAEIERGGYGSGGTGGNPTASGRYTSRVQLPSNSVRSYSAANVATFTVPTNWREFASQTSVQFAPDGGFGDQGITHGAMVGIYPSQQSDLRSSSQQYVDEILQANSYLRQRSNLTNTYVGGRRGFTMQASGQSPITGRAETTTFYTTQLRSGDLIYIVTVAPTSEAYSYNNSFRTMLNSFRFND